MSAGGAATPLFTNAIFILTSEACLLLIALPPSGQKKKNYWRFELKNEINKHDLSTN